MRDKLIPFGSMLLSVLFLLIGITHFAKTEALAGVVLATSAQQPSIETSAEVARIINELRANPSGFIPEVNKYVTFWKSFVSNKKNLEKAGIEAIARLETQQALPLFALDSGLVKASMRHVKDGENMGILGHIGSDNSNPATRAADLGWYSTISECITYGQTTAARIVAAFIVDENTPDRGHRESLLNPQLNLIGVSIGSHPKYDTQCVVMLAAH
ncbi:MAG: CAP domain-containing protein [Ignavibacteria bacterium]|nr:CAP domain-containing protein [Ignavibacteria bacterium]